MSESLCDTRRVSKGWTVLLLIACVLLSLACLHLPFNWTGIDADGSSHDLGQFRSLEECKLKVGKTGGWCGKGCKRYGDLGYADCSPLIPIPKASN
jgi:hypothetical protein